VPGDVGVGDKLLAAGTADLFPVCVLLSKLVGRALDIDQPHGAPLAPNERHAVDFHAALTCWTTCLGSQQVESGFREQAKRHNDALAMEGAASSVADSLKAEPGWIGGEQRECRGDLTEMDNSSGDEVDKRDDFELAVGLQQNLALAGDGRDLLDGAPVKDLDGEESAGPDTVGSFPKELLRSCLLLCGAREAVPADRWPALLVLCGRHFGRDSPVDGARDRREPAYPAEQVVDEPTPSEQLVGLARAEGAVDAGVDVLLSRDVDGHLEGVEYHSQ